MTQEQIQALMQSAPSTPPSTTEISISQFQQHLQDEQQFRAFVLANLKQNQEQIKDLDRFNWRLVWINGGLLLAVLLMALFPLFQDFQRARALLPTVPQTAHTPD